MNPFTIKRKKPVFLIAFVALTVFFFTGCKKIPAYIATSATVEAGNTFSASDFLLEEGHTAEFETEFAGQFVSEDVAKIGQVGTHSVGLIVDGESYHINVTVQDTVPPKASTRKIILSQGDSLTPEQCVTDIKDQTTVSCTFQAEPDLMQPGQTDEIVVLTDEGGNQTEVPVEITVLAKGNLLVDTYTIEAGESTPPLEELIVFHKTGTYVTDLSAINTSLAGSYPLEVKINGEIYSSELIIEDTIPPTATITPVTAYFGAVFPSADSFVSDIIDEGPVTASYETDPGTNVSEPVDVRIVLTDQGGNRTVYDSRCSVAVDDEAPKFTAFPEELDADVDSAIIWRVSVSAEDNSGVIDLSLDTTGVDLTKPGTYTAFFVAKDPAGNETRQEVKLILHDNSVTKEMMDQLCAEIVAKIITEDMTTREKLQAVCNYVRSRVTYTNAGVHDDIRREAYLGLTTRRSGDCFTFCAASKELLSYLGYESQIVRRREDCAKEIGYNHFWLLVNCGTEEEPLWYHHDSCPQYRHLARESYMMTDAQVKAYTNFRADNSPRMKHYYTFDTSLHPASATEMVLDLKIDSKYYE